MHLSWPREYQLLIFSCIVQWMENRIGVKQGSRLQKEAKQKQKKSKKIQNKSKTTTKQQQNNNKTTTKQQQNKTKTKQNKTKTKANLTRQKNQNKKPKQNKTIVNKNKTKMKYGSKISLLVTYSLPRPSPLNLFHMLPVCFNVFCGFVCLLVCLSFP